MVGAKEKGFYRGSAVTGFLIAHRKLGEDFGVDKTIVKVTVNNY